MNYIQKFYLPNPTLENQWRAILLFGRNTASYKFALAKSLAEISQNKPNELILLDELARPFSKHLCAHIKEKDKQGTITSSQFLDACRLFNAGQINEDKLIETTIKRGFNNVLDAFHTVNSDTIPKLFFLDERKQNNGIRLTENFFHLFEQQSADILNQETESRWRLVEEAWSLNIARHLIDIKYDHENKRLYSSRTDLKRIDITSCRDALNGYQKAKCFYCYCDIDIVSGSENLADVDHFLPFTLLQYQPDMHLNGVWNLVLACQECNRGDSGKFAKLPTLLLLKRLHQRNEYLISSYHPLRETIIRQTGLNEKERHTFLQTCYTQAINYLIHTWEPIKQGESIF